MNPTCEFYLKYVKYPQYEIMFQTDLSFSFIAQLLTNTVSLLFLESRIPCRLYIFEKKKIFLFPSQSNICSVSLFKCMTFKRVYRSYKFISVWVRIFNPFQVFNMTFFLMSLCFLLMTQSQH